MILFTSLLPKIVILEFTSSREGKTPFTIIFFHFLLNEAGSSALPDLRCFQSYNSRIITLSVNGPGGCAKPPLDGGRQLVSRLRRNFPSDTFLLARVV